MAHWSVIEIPQFAPSSAEGLTLYRASGKIPLVFRSRCTSASFEPWLDTAGGRDLLQIGGNHRKNEGSSRPVSNRIQVNHRAKAEGCERASPAYSVTRAGGQVSLYAFS